MKKGEVVVLNDTGLHARPASLFVKRASEFTSDVRITAGEKEVNAKSIMSVMSLGADKGTTVTIWAEGVDEEKAVAVLIKFIKEDLADRD